MGCFYAAAGLDAAFLPLYIHHTKFFFQTKIPRPITVYHLHEPYGKHVHTAFLLPKFQQERSICMNKIPVAIAEALLALVVAVAAEAIKTVSE